MANAPAFSVRALVQRLETTSITGGSIDDRKQGRSRWYNSSNSNSSRNSSNNSRNRGTSTINNGNNSNEALSHPAATPATPPRCFDDFPVVASVPCPAAEHVRLPTPAKTPGVSRGTVDPIFPTFGSDEEEEDEAAGDEAHEARSWMSIISNTPGHAVDNDHRRLGAEECAVKPMASARPPLKTAVVRRDASAQVKYVDGALLRSHDSIDSAFRTADDARLFWNPIRQYLQITDAELGG